MTVEQSIEKRVSTRNFDPLWNDEELINKVVNYCKNIERTKGPFGTSIKIDSLLKDKLDKDIKLGTYGMITGCNNYLVVSYNKENYNLIDLGYLFEQVVLYITSLGLGSVWMAGTYSKKNFTKALNLSNDDKIIIVCPFGKPETKKSFVSKVVSRSKVRKNFEDLFFDKELNPLKEDDSKYYTKPLQMVRLAPSSMNKQYWRVVVDKIKHEFDFYSSTPKDSHDVNVGIALAHFDLMMKEQEVEGSIIRNSNSELLSNYKCTWKKE